MKRMKNLKEIIKVSIVAGMMIVVSSCQESEILHEINPRNRSNAYIEFGNYVHNMTRASKTVGKGGFAVGDTMAVWGIQDTDGEIDVIFNNHDIRYVEDGSWTYDNKKLWNIGSDYMFYGMFPYSKSLYTMSNDGKWFISIPTFTTPDDPSKQTDLMISERRDVDPFNTVDMYFHHILSNVNIYAKVSDDLDTTGIESITIKEFRFYNIRSTGSYAQTGWDHNRAVGAWTNLSGYMSIPGKTDIVITKKTTALYSDYLMIPQTLFSTDAQPKDVNIDATFKIVYKDGTTSTYIKKGIRLAGINGTSNANSKPISEWLPNYRYNYTLAFNPQKVTRIWDADGDGSLQIDPVTGDTITKTDDTPYPGIAKYNPEEPDVIYLYEDTDNDGKPDSWVPVPIVWEDIDGDDQLEAGFDRDGDGHIDNIDDDNVTQKVPGGDPDKDPSDGNDKNPDGKDVILVHIDTDGDGDIDDDDDWVQLQKDITTGIITPVRELQDATIQFSATVHEWDEVFSVNYDI